MPAMVDKLPLDRSGDRCRPWFRELAPGRVAVIWMVGKSTAGNAATGSRR